MSDSEKDSESEDNKETVAVALGHDLVDDRPPKVVAGGRGRIAEQILEIAFAHGVKVREDADLAQLLTSIDIDSEIPVEAFAAVAEILTYVYQANAGHPAPGEQGPGEQGPGEQGPGEQGPGEQGPGEQGNGAGPSDGGLSNLWSKETE